MELKKYFYIILFFLGTTFIHPIGWFLLPSFVRNYTGEWIFEILVNVSSYALMFLFVISFVKKVEKFESLKETLSFLGVKKID